MSSKKWIFPECDKEAARSLAEECGIEPLCALLMLSRGIDDPVEIDEFFSCEELQIEDPYLLTDMDRAVGRINKAIENGDLPQGDIPQFNIEKPANKANGDYSTNVALAGAKAF